MGRTCTVGIVLITTGARVVLSDGASNTVMRATAVRVSVGMSVLV